MSGYEKVMSAKNKSTAAGPRLSNEPVPQLCPTPMPKQIVLLWTPRVAVAAATRAVIGLCRLQRGAQPAAITMPNSDEP